MFPWKFIFLLKDFNLFVMFYLYFYLISPRVKQIPSVLVKSCISLSTKKEFIKMFKLVYVWVACDSMRFYIVYIIYALFVYILFNHVIVWNFFNEKSFVVTISNKNKQFLLRISLRYLIMQGLWIFLAKLFSVYQ